LNFSDGFSDSDGDGLTNYNEFLLGINPKESDTDHDFFNDKIDSDPLNLLMPTGYGLGLVGLLMLVMVVSIVTSAKKKKRRKEEIKSAKKTTKGKSKSNKK